MNKQAVKTCRIAARHHPLQKNETESMRLRAVKKKWNSMSHVRRGNARKQLMEGR